MGFAASTATPDTMNSRSKSASVDLLTPAAESLPAPASRAGASDTGAASEPEAHSTGILPSQELEQLVRVSKDISALEPIQDDRQGRAPDPQVF